MTPPSPFGRVNQSMRGATARAPKIINEKGLNIGFRAITFGTWRIRISNQLQMHAFMDMTTFYHIVVVFSPKIDWLAE